MKNINARELIFESLKLPELIAQAIEKNSDYSYEESLKLITDKFNDKIEEAQRNFSELGRIKDISIKDEKSLDEFLENKEVIKG